MVVAMLPPLLMMVVMRMKATITVELITVRTMGHDDDDDDEESEDKVGCHRGLDDIDNGSNYDDDDCDHCGAADDDDGDDSCDRDKGGYNNVTA